jgi:hypothetical protein
MTWQSQNQFKVRNLVLSDKKQKAWGTAVTDAQMVQRVPFDSSSYAALAVAFGSDQARVGKGTTFPTERWATDQTVDFSNLAFDLDDYLLGWIPSFAMGSLTTTGSGAPFTHTIVFDESQGDAVPTTIYTEDTSGLKQRFLDMCVNQAQFSGSAKGPVQASVTLMGTGKLTSGAIASLPDLATRTMLMFMDTALLIGAPGSPAAIDADRIASWSITLNNNLVRRSGPGSGLFSTKITTGQQVAQFSATIFAKETDDLVTLLLGQTEQELQININSGSACQLKFDFPSIFLSAAQVGTQDGLVVLNISSDQNSILAGASAPLTVTAINSQASYLVAAT